VFEPQGTGFFLLLIVAFAALLVWVAVAKHVVFRVLAASLAFLPAMMFGIAAVNKFLVFPSFAVSEVPGWSG